MCNENYFLYQNLEERLKQLGIKNILAGVAFAETEDEYLTQDSFKFHTRMGYEQVATNLYRGIYSGNVSFKDINKKDLDWMRPIKTQNK